VVITRESQNNTERRGDRDRESCDEKKKNDRVREWTPRKAAQEKVFGEKERSED